MAKAPKERGTTPKTGRKEECESFTAGHILRAGNWMAGGGSSGGSGGGGSSITVAWSLQSELAMRTEEQPLANKHFGKAWHQNKWEKGFNKPAVTELLCLCILDKTRILSHQEKNKFCLINTTQQICVRAEEKKISAYWQGTLTHTCKWTNRGCDSGTSPCAVFILRPLGSSVSPQTGLWVIQGISLQLDLSFLLESIHLSNNALPLCFSHQKSQEKYIE